MILPTCQDGDLKNIVSCGIFLQSDDCKSKRTVIFTPACVYYDKTVMCVYYDRLTYCLFSPSLFDCLFFVRIVAS